MKQYPFIASRIFGVPLLVDPSRLQIILAVMQDRIGYSVPDEWAIRAAEVEPVERFVGNYEVVAGVAVMPIAGTLVSRDTSLNALSGGMLGYDRIAQGIETANEDDEVRSILLDFSTHGGEAAGVDDAADVIRASRKPTTAIINHAAFSAGYWLASSTDRVIATRSALVGSIGVVLTHMSARGMAEQLGVKITHIHAGVKKVDLSPYFDLSERAQVDAQALVDGLYDQFVRAVARYRGIDATAVRATEAGIYSADAAVDAGLVDRIDSYQSILSELQAARPPAISMSTHEGKIMTAQTEAPANLDEPEVQSAIQAAAEQARIEAVATERGRIKSIIEHEQAEGRGRLALSLALESDMDAETAARILETAPEQPAPGSGKITQLTPFEAAMGRIGNPAISAGGDPWTEEQELDAAAKRIAGVQ